MIYSKDKLSKLLDISDMFLMIDEVIEIKSGKYSYCTKKISEDDWFIKAHLPNVGGIMPGTLLTEAMLQGTVIIIYLNEGTNNKPVFVNKYETRLYKKVKPPTILEIYSYIDSSKNGIIHSHSEIKFDGKMMCKGIFSYVIPDQLPQMHKNIISKIKK